MSPAKQRARLKGFLIGQEGFYNDIFQRVAKTRYEIVCKQLDSHPTLDEFKKQHYGSIEQEVGKVIDEFCKEVIPGNQYVYLFIQISIFAIFLLPPIYPLLRYSISLWRNPDFNLAEFSVCAGSILLLLMLMGATALAVFLNSYPKH